ncbi:hypothetical protein Ciccas_008203 [Cichlidogyrus casuarinus]|uniref:Uncharacterized protein n=1 Tax=Cichlidogyrus casuarinus TaxID=1844966 RepID=A0ABD2Q1F4_9PLAT
MGFVAEKSGGFLKKVKSKLSRSTQNLSEIGTIIRSHTQSIRCPARRHSVDAIDCISAVPDETPQDVGRSRAGSIFKPDPACSVNSNPFGGSDSDLADEVGPTPTPTKGTPAGESPFVIRAGQKQPMTNGTMPKTHKRMVSGASDLFDLLNSNGETALSTPMDGRWGMHPEEQIADSKPLEAMNRSEMITKIQALQSQNNSEEVDDACDRLSNRDLHSSATASQQPHPQQQPIFSNPLRALANANAKEEDHFNWW